MTAVMRGCWLTWCARTPHGTGRWPGTARPRKGIKVLARAHQPLIWERNRSVLRLRSTLAGVLPGRAAGLP